MLQISMYHLKRSLSPGTEHTEKPGGKTMYSYNANAFRKEHLQQGCLPIFAEVGGLLYFQSFLIARQD